jgi:hypothetical protein
MERAKRIPSLQRLAGNPGTFFRGGFFGSCTETQGGEKNLYHSTKQAMRDLGESQGAKWLNISAICRSFRSAIGHGASLEKIYYFSALAKHLEASLKNHVGQHFRSGGFDQLQQFLGSENADAANFPVAVTLDPLHQIRILRQVSAHFRPTKKCLENVSAIFLGSVSYRHGHEEI